MAACGRAHHEDCSCGACVDPAVTSWRDEKEYQVDESKDDCSARLGEIVRCLLWVSCHECCFLEIRAHAMLAYRVLTRVLSVWLVFGRSIGSCCPPCVREKPLAVELFSCPCGQEARNMPRFGVRRPGRLVRLRHLGKRCCVAAGVARLAGRGVRRRLVRLRGLGCWLLLLVGICCA